MLRAALIVGLAVATPAAADLWTSRSPGSAHPNGGSPGPPASAEGGGARPAVEVPRTPDGDRGAPFTLTVVVDPTCPASAASVQDAAAFARAHHEVAVRVLLATRPGGSGEAVRALLAWAEAGIPVTWAPAAVRRLAPTAVPMVYLQNARGRGVQAAGRPPLETLWRTVHGGSP